ncbi:MAG: hypothetical protein NTU88_09655, partial [Armatimonadetes bacterium]|nr:hypothetical protein [Armatimonadota bacterium]
PLMHWQQMLAHTQPLPGLTVSGTWMLRYVVRTCVAFLLWIGNWEVNHQWVLSEREKRYNFWPLTTIVLLGVFGWFASGWMFGPFWLAITVLAVGLQATVEARRPFVLLQRPSPPDAEAAEIRPGDRFYYREGTSLARRVLLLNAGALIFVLGFVRDWESMSFAFIIIVVSTASALGFRREFVITREKITGRFGLVRLLIPMSDVRSCTIADPHPLTESFRGHRGWGHTWDGMQLYGDATGPMLRINTAEGKTYLLGVKKPKTACALIRSALSHPS